MIFQTNEYLDMCKNMNENPNKEVMFFIKNYNKNLIMEYPFLTSHGNLGFTEMDNLPKGWRIAFGQQLLEDLKNALLQIAKRNNKNPLEIMNSYKIYQIKEKYGVLRWYDNHSYEDKEIENVLNKYEILSEKTCINCGKPAKYATLGWINYLCEDCAKPYLGKLSLLED